MAEIDIRFFIYLVNLNVLIGDTVTKVTTSRNTTYLYINRGWYTEVTAIY